ncbi:uncharacterized protein SAPINGB_P005233 [Magnusiomyces paraingens]|uniref:Zn(2)-C6 fungal-type domain-containing protein n=1 Tax=Magnusiomyces paraingens TaxID=2606893 RepID=A0A5E8C027_9ASCO|nr:uncharacterized protein SAPINGB_P005233 [Saprochaete ingens]VVT56722.1 unnamed protein product [Saprochaete ingens]
MDRKDQGAGAPTKDPPANFQPKPLSNSDSKQGVRLPAKRRSYSCGPCKTHKTKCDQSVPCSSCCRYRREDQCLKDPATPSVTRPVVRSDKGYRQIEISRFQPAIVTASNNKITSSSSSTMTTTSTTASSRITKPILKTLSTQSTARILQLEARVRELESLLAKPDRPSSRSTPAELANDSPKDFIDKLWQSEEDIRILLLRLLPPRSHCETYVKYYFEHVDYIYHPLHNRTFLRELKCFWSQPADTIDLTWVAILFMVISLAALHLPKALAKQLNVADETISHAAAIWFRASRKALQTNRYDEKPTFRQLQVFSLTQLYLYATNQIELLNSLLAEAVRHAQFLGLHLGIEGRSPIETELRRHIWWDICGCDTFQSLCLGRPTLVKSCESTVPFPRNLNEEDVEKNVPESPREIPTIMSFQIERHRVMKILNRLCPNTNNSPPSYEAVLDTDRELCEYAQGLPWFFQPAPDPSQYSALLAKMPTIGFQHHVLHTCNCMHRVRIHQPFLHPRVPTSWAACHSAVKAMFLVYRRLCASFPGGVSGSYSFIPQIHQSFSAAVAQGLFLLVEKPPDSDAICGDVETFVTDLYRLLETFYVDIPILTTGIKTIRQIRDAMSVDGKRQREPSPTIVSEVYSVFGGRKNTEKYLARCTIDFLVNDSDMDKQQQQQQQQLQQQQEDTAGSVAYQPSPTGSSVSSMSVGSVVSSMTSASPSSSSMFDVQSMWSLPGADVVEESLKIVHEQHQHYHQNNQQLMRHDSVGLVAGVSSGVSLGPIPVMGGSQAVSPGGGGGEGGGWTPGVQSISGINVPMTPGRPQIDFLRWDLNGFGELVNLVDK